MHWGTVQLAAYKQVPISLALCPPFFSSYHIVLQEKTSKCSTCFPNGWQVITWTARKGRVGKSRLTRCHSRDLTFCKVHLKTSSPTTAMQPSGTVFRSHSVWRHCTAPTRCQCSSTPTSQHCNPRSDPWGQAHNGKEKQSQQRQWKTDRSFGTYTDQHSKLPRGNFISVITTITAQPSN